MKGVIACAILAVNFLFSASARAETISFVTTEFPPYVIKQGDRLSGFEVEFVQELCRKLGAEAEFTLVPWNRALEYVKHGQVDGILMPVYSEERAEYIYFTDLPIGHERISIMSLPGSGIKAKSLDDLKSELIGVIFGYSYGKEFDENKVLKMDRSYDNDLLLKKLNLGRYRLVASDENVINHVARQAGQAELEIVLNLKDNPKFLGFSKAVGPRGKDLATRFSQAIRDLQQDGTLEKIRKKYF
ncbi:MAG TPA: transporter substrate-binding domain-containing protein [Burkholderiaceae bacterium]|nr:transporter substrate-binding domain-containing protein [Burkholderiaceae bacterium]